MSDNYAIAATPQILAVLATQPIIAVIAASGQGPDYAVVATPQMLAVLATQPTLAVIAAGGQGPEGIQGASGTGVQIAYAFAWGDATPANIVDVPSGKTVFRVDVVILAPFDVASVLTIGDSSNNARLFGADDIDLTTAGTYQTNPAHSYSGITAINLYLALGGGVSSGNGLILLFIQE